MFNVHCNDTKKQGKCKEKIEEINESTLSITYEHIQFHRHHSLRPYNQQTLHLLALASIVHLFFF